MCFVRWGSQCHRRKVQYKEGRSIPTGAGEPILPHILSVDNEVGQTALCNGAKGRKIVLGGGHVAKYGWSFHWQRLQHNTVGFLKASRVSDCVHKTNYEKASEVV